MTRLQYKLVTVVGHPFSRKSQRWKRVQEQIYEHRHVVEKAMGRYIDPKHPIHHVNGNILDNRPENLVLCEDAAHHFLLHVKQRAFAACGNASWRKCCYCQAYDDLANLAHEPSRPKRLFHRRCQQAFCAGPRKAKRRARKERTGRWS